jgi:hypothetical protein
MDAGKNYFHLPHSFLPKLMFTGTASGIGAQQARRFSAKEPKNFLKANAP